MKKRVGVIGIGAMGSTIAYQFYTAGQNTDMGKKDHTAVVQLIETLAGEKIGTVPE